jgi:phage-related protein
LLWQVSDHEARRREAMPPVEVILYQEGDAVPLMDWLAGLVPDARDRCLARLALLEEYGHDLRRPHAEYLEGTDLYELRVKFHRVNYRMLYFFHGRTAAVVSHGFSKEDKIPPGEIRLATARMEKFQAHPTRHGFRGEE